MFPFIFGEGLPFHDLLEAQPMLCYWVIVLILVAALTVSIFYKRGVATCIPIVVYLMALSSMSMLIRNCYVNHNFNFPLFVTSTHCLSTTIAGTCILVGRYFMQGTAIDVPSTKCFFTQVVPIAITFAASLGLSNCALLYGNVHVYEMGSAATPLATALVTFLLGQGIAARLWLPLTVATMSVLLITSGETGKSTIGFLFCAPAILLRSFKVTLQSMLLKGKMNMDPIAVAAWSNMVCFVVMFSWSLCSSGLKPFDRIMEAGPMGAVLLTCACATVMNISALFVLRELGPVVQQVVGQLKGIISCVGAMVVFGELINRQQIIGYSVLMVSIAWYNSWDMAIIAEKKHQDLDEKTPVLKKSSV